MLEVGSWSADKKSDAGGMQQTGGVIGEGPVRKSKDSDALNASQSRSVATTLRLRISTSFHDLDGYRWELSVQEESDEMTSLAQTGILML